MKKGESLLGNILFRLYAFPNARLRGIILSLIRRFEHGDLYSVNLRKIFSKYHKVDIGMYSMGGCFREYNLDKYTKVGRYCSIAQTACSFNRNHPLDYKSTHPFFFNPIMNICKEDTIEYTPLEIGNDVWLGHNSIIMPNVRHIGDGAVVAAGSVVSKDVPPYAVMVGHPARLVKYRFSKETIDRLMAEKWWEKDIDELKNEKEFFGVYEAAPDGSVI